MGIGVGKGRTPGLMADHSQVFEFALTGAETVRNFTQRASVAQLAEQHGHELIPTGKAFGAKVGFEFPGVPGKIGTLKKREDLAK